MKNILKQAENAERLLKLTSDTMLLLNRDGICMDIAVHNVNLWFMKEEKLLGKNLFQLIPPSTYYQVYPEFKKVLTQKVRSVHNYEMTLGHTTYYFKCIMYPYDGMVPASTATSQNAASANWNSKRKTTSSTKYKRPPSSETGNTIPRPAYSVMQAIRVSCVRKRCSTSIWTIIWNLSFLKTGKALPAG